MTQTRQMPTFPSKLPLGSGRGGYHDNSHDLPGCGCAPWEFFGTSSSGERPEPCLLVSAEKKTDLIQVDGIRLIEEVTTRLVHPIADEVDPVLLLGIV